ncbi:adventurous gliding motility protein AgmC [Archangium sp.]|uniref:adventurous gliding motility protein AgmC n=1 Tax=Archangium sp. TaxID=1872627 RepID=UPI002D60D3D3|nr:Ig-like domain-containing protein [Archangium sp.]HYO55704.1 Ig-like domain-containing protein [Archangium sp.]
MKNQLFKKWLGAALCVVALGSTAALAEPDSFGLGTGRNNTLTVTTAGTVINSYAQVKALLTRGSTTITVGSTTGFGSGDLIMVLQSAGTEPVPASGDISGLPVGSWEFARLDSVSGTTLTLTAPLVRGYAADVTQVIRVPEYTDVTITGAGNIVAQPWDRSTGGVVAFLAQGTVNNNGEISASGAGFLGGPFVNDTSGKTGCLELDEPGPSGALKGESIASNRYGPGNTGRGNAANGGGGGVCFRAGGGGGSNGGAGGQGGSSADGGGRSVGGMGGVKLTYSQLHRLTFGGGGGVGHGSSGAAQAGGVGGGIVFIRANQLSGTGFITSTGTFGGFSNSDAASGGGGGGSIYLRFAGTADCSDIDASGGTGGSTNASRVGPGGGGGGGQLLFQAQGGNCVPDATNASGANPGTQKAVSVPASYGAQSGSIGVFFPVPGGFVVPPVPSVTSPTGSINNRRPAITGTTEPNTTVVIYIDGVEVGRATSNSTGAYIFPVSADLSEGSHTVQAATERDAVQSAKSTAITFIVDTKAPDTRIVSGPPSSSNTRNATFDLDVVEADTGVTYECKLSPATTFTSCTDPAAFTVPADGPYTLEVRARDAAGNVDDSPASHTWTVDTKAPDARIVSGPPSSRNTRNATFDLDVVEPDAGVTYECKLSPATTFTSCTDPAAFTVPADGPYTLEVRARDAAGNVDDSPATYTWTVDTLPPEVPVVESPAQNGSVDTLTPVISGRAEPNSTVTIIIGGQVVGTVRTDASGNWSYTPTTPLTPGSHQVQVRATDEAGNTGNTSEPHTFTVVQDTTAPETNISSGPSGTTPEPSATFELDSNEPGVSFECSLDGADYTPCTSPVTFNNLAEGEHTLQVRARDAAGNVDATPATHTWTVTGGDIAFLGDGLGCSATGGDSSLVLMGLGSFLALARRRRRN